MKSAIIIGGGFGGLTTGALLAREGMDVTVIEKNHHIGGGLQSFRRDGIDFETGMHILGGFNEGDTVYRIFDYIGILDRLRLKRSDPDCMDQITYLSPTPAPTFTPASAVPATTPASATTATTPADSSAGSITYRIPQGRAAFTEALCRYFPAESDGIVAYVEALYQIADEVDFFNLRPTDNFFKVHSDRFMQPVDEFIAGFVSDPRLQDLLAYMNPMYGGVRHQTPAYIHALINVLYIKGQFHFIGRSQHMAEELARVITEHGGRVISGDAVTAVEVEDKRATAVVTAQGKRFTADYVINTLHPQQLFDLLPEGALSKAYITRLSEAPLTYSAFILYIVFKPESFPYINHTCYLQDDYGLVWSHGDYDDATWPRGMMYITPPTEDQGPWAQRMTVNCIMPWAQVAQWADTRVGHRGADYEAWKRRLAERIIDKMEKLYPGFRDKVQTYIAASPLTIRDYYGSPCGALYGYQKDAHDPARTMVMPVTKIPNLLLSGQCVNLHGICGVPLTAINTAEVIFGTNTIINKINAHAAHS